MTPRVLPDGLFRVLGNKTRLNILRALFVRSKTIDELSEELGISTSTCRHHIKLLSQYGYIEQSEDINNHGQPERSYSVGRLMPYVDFPQRRYIDLAEGLAQYLRPFLGEATFKEVISEMGESMGIDTVTELEAAFHSKNWTVAAFLDIFVKGYLKSIGAEPIVLISNDSSAVYHVTNCGYHEAAFHNPDVYCDSLECGFNSGVSKAMGTVTIRRLKCAAKENSYCEFIVEAKA